jgi:hypothetical protein
MVELIARCISVGWPVRAAKNIWREELMRISRHCKERLVSTKRIPRNSLKWQQR